jgi:hypothetical protein
MRIGARQPIDGGPGPSTATAGSPASAVRVPAILALQQRIGNAAVTRMLARDPPTDKQDPLAKYRPAEPDKPLALPPQWTNPNLIKVAYPGREAMFRKFVGIYRELELGPSATKAVRDKALAEVANLSGPSLQKEVDRLLASSVVPSWLKDQVRDYAGMRYYQDPTIDTRKHGAHTSYYSAVRLIYVVKREAGDWTRARAEERKAAQDAVEAWRAMPSKTPQDRQKRGPQPPAPPLLSATSKTEKAWLAMSEENAMSRLVQMHDGPAGRRIPNWAWHAIVRLTPLRAKFAGPDWDDVSKEIPDPDDAYWKKVISAWTGGETIGWFYGGGTQWRPETLDEGHQVATALVCNELSETTQIKRGVRLPGGIRKNAEYFVAKASEGRQPSAKPEVAGSYFRRVSSAADLRPGATIFWIKSDWTPPPKNNKGKVIGEIDNSNMVFPIPDIEWPMPYPPEYEEEWSAWRKRKQTKTAWDAKKARLTWDAKTKDNTKELTEKEQKQLGDDPGDPGEEPTYTRTELPADGEEVDGWTYTVKGGQGITRERDDEKQWMTWLHQATILKAMDDGRVFLLETTLLNPADRNSGVTGFTQRSMKEMLTPFVYVGYIPGTVDANAARP